MDALFAGRQALLRAAEERDAEAEEEEARLRAEEKAAAVFARLMELDSRKADEAEYVRLLEEDRWKAEEEHRRAVEEERGRAEQVTGAGRGYGEGAS
jgi:hypothetical protein